MKASELVAQLQALIAEHSDCDVAYLDREDRDSFAAVSNSEMRVLRRAASCYYPEHSVWSHCPVTKVLVLY